jgi:hypothetical protein
MAGLLAALCHYNKHVSVLSFNASVFSSIYFFLFLSSIPGKSLIIPCACICSCSCAGGLAKLLTGAPGLPGTGDLGQAGEPCADSGPD